MMGTNRQESETDKKGVIEEQQNKTEAKRKTGQG